MARYRGRHRAPNTPAGPSPAQPSGRGRRGPLWWPPPRPTPPPTPCGTASPSADQRQLEHQHRQRVLRRAPVHLVDVAGLRRSSSPTAPTTPAVSSRSSWPSACSRDRAGGRGRCAPARPERQARRSRSAAPPATPKPQPAAARSPPLPPVVGGYLIQRGDTLSKTATRRHVAGGYKALLAKNPALKNPNRIFPGQHLKV